MSGEKNHHAQVVQIAELLLKKNWSTKCTEKGKLKSVEKKTNTKSTYIIK